MTRWLATLGVLLFPFAPIPGQTPRTQPVRQVGYLVTSNGSAIPYHPQPGDIVVCDDENRLYHFVFKFAGTSPPTHTSIAFAGVDGQPMLLDLTGPSLVTSKVTLFDVASRFHSYPGTVQVRRLRTPLTQEQSRELTSFAHDQCGKRFAFGRVLLQGTPFCPRSGLRHALFGHTYLNRQRWFCSELVIAACCKASLLDPRSCCGNALYPRDLAVDERFDLSPLYHPPMTWSPR